MKSIENFKKVNQLSSKMFQELKSEEILSIHGGAIFPKKGTTSLGWTMMDGQTAEYSADWSTGWFSSTQNYGDAYVSGTD